MFLDLSKFCERKFERKFFEGILKRVKAEILLCNFIKIGWVVSENKIFEKEVNSLPNNKGLDWSRIKDITDDKINVTQILKFVSSMGENIVGKGENTGYQHFLLFPQYFQKASISGS